MKTILLAMWTYTRDFGRALSQGWNKFWFSAADPTTLAGVRIVTGLVLLYAHLTSLPVLIELMGPDAWVDKQAVQELRTSTHPWLSTEPYVQSLWLYVDDPAAIWVLHSLFLIGTLCFTLGLFSRAASVVVWAGHLSYVQRGWAIWYGMDTMLAFLTLYMMFGPTGGALSLDRLIARYRKTRNALKGRARTLPEMPVQPSVAANIVIRMLQIHMCFVYTCSGLAKLQGGLWWDGTAVYYTLVMTDFAPINLLWIGKLPDWMVHGISTAGVFFTLFTEVGLVFLVWNRRLKPLMLFCGFMLHIGISLTMGLGTFQVAMMAVLLSFVAPESVRWFVEALFKGPGGLRYVYDRAQVGQVRLASLAHAADAWKQVEIVDAHDKSAAGVPAGSLSTPDGVLLQGYDAFQRLSRSLRGLWPLGVWTFVPGCSLLFRWFFRDDGDRAERSDKTTPVGAKG